MFSDKFVRQAPRLHYRYHTIGTSSDDSKGCDDKPLPMTEVVTQPGRLSYAMKHPSSCSSSLYKNIKRRESTMLNHPLLRKRTSAQKNQLVLTKSSYYPPPLHYTPMKDVSQCSRPAPELIANKLKGLHVSRNMSVCSAPGQVIEYRHREQSLSTRGSYKPRDVVPCLRKQPFPLNVDSVLRATSQMDCAQSSSVEVSC